MLENLALLQHTRGADAKPERIAQTAMVEIARLKHFFAVPSYLQVITQRSGSRAVGTHSG
jgi:hypothetical protein